MVAVQAITALLALVSPLLVRADVTPSEPSPGSSFNVGSKCRVTWEGDKDSAANWKDMAIELMSGDNLNMVHITTVTTGEDGTKDGKFEFTCPDVTPNSAIYFYQFTAAHAPVKTWTTRFTIASASGDSVAPANSKQPDGDGVPWGVGKLVDPSKGTAAPPWVTGGTVANATTGANSTSANVTSSTVSSSTPTKMLASATSKSSSSTPIGTSSAANMSSTGAAVGLAAMDKKVWFGAIGAFVFAALL